MGNDAWPAEKVSPVFKLGDWSQLIRGSPMCTYIGNICSLTTKFGFDRSSVVECLAVYIGLGYSSSTLNA